MIMSHVSEPNDSGGVEDCVRMYAGNFENGEWVNQGKWNDQKW